MANIGAGMKYPTHATPPLISHFSSAEMVVELRAVDLCGSNVCSQLHTDVKLAWAAYVTMIAILLVFCYTSHIRFVYHSQYGAFSHFLILCIFSVF